MASPTLATIGFHDQRYALEARHAGWLAYKGQTEFTYTFENFFHPFVSELIEQLNRESLPGMLDPAYHQKLAARFFDDFYTASTSALVRIHAFPKEIDLREGGPYANYNWELLFHIPLVIATHLSKNQRFAEAQRWFHYVFDPTSGDTALPTPQRFWKFLAFRRPEGAKPIDELLALLSKPGADATQAELELKQRILDGYAAIRNRPFQPHAVARTRHLAYQYCVVMKYLDNLIAWGDHLFRQDTAEALNEATQRYVLAANILGERPQRIPLRGTVRPKTFAELKQAGLDAMGNALVDLEGQFPFNLALPQTPGTDSEAATALLGIGRTLYFCIPRNDRLLAYWDTVADRLFKLRHCMTIEGVVRQLPLFDPPIDPGLLVKAAAAGIPLGAVLAGLTPPVGPVRALFLIQKALELAGEVRALGAALLSAIEKQDGERLARLRQQHETNIHRLQQEVLFLRWKQAEESTSLLLQSRATVVERYRYYRRLLGRESDGETVPPELPLDRRELTAETFDEAYAALVTQYAGPLRLDALPRLTLVDGASPSTQSGASGTGRLYVTANEDADLNEHARESRRLMTAATVNDAVGESLIFVPPLILAIHYWGIGSDLEIPFGQIFGAISRIVSSSLNTAARLHDSEGTSASKTAAYERRADEWLHQKNLAAGELMSIGRQIIGSLIGEQTARREYLNGQEQIRQSMEIAHFFDAKFTGAELYAWMQGELSRLYYEYYRFAFDTARRAEQAMKRELMRPEVDGVDYVRFNYWDAGRKGLLSGEALHLDVKRMEIAYHENNRREYELTKHVSLRQLSPLALLTLKATGVCEVRVPEWLFDLDGAGHYMRRIKTASVSIPSVSGPYTSVSCTLTLLASSVRRSPALPDGDYARHPGDDDRFVDYFGGTQSIVTSTGTSDDGMFETNLRDERVLPFEGAGAVSTWRLELPAEFRQFDYDTIADVVLTLRYTARQGGAELKRRAVEHIESLAGEADQAGLALLFSLKHDFPGEWHRFVTGDADFQTSVRREYFPYLTQGRTVTVTAVELHGVRADQLRSLTTPDLDLQALTTALNETGACPLSLTADPEVLVRDQRASVFALIKYSMTRT
jgi:hypothetical protein